MKNLKLTLAAVLCCLLTSTLFTGCVKNEDEDDDKTVSYAALVFWLQNTSDMINYCNVEVTYGDGKEENHTTAVTEKNTTLDLSWGGTLVPNSLPCTVTFTRKVTVKADAELEKKDKFVYSRGYMYTTGVYNAAGSLIKQTGTETKPEELTVTGATAAALIAEGKLNQTFTFTFDEKGEVTVKVDMAE